MPRERQCKLVVIGDGSVGKTSVIKAFVDDGFQRAYKQTIGCDFFEKSIILQQQTRVSLSVWDVGGQSAASNNIANYLEGAHVGFFCYDVTNAESFLNISDWLRRIRQCSAGSQLARFYLLGNKIDLRHLRQVTEKQHKELIDSERFHDGFFTSARSGENVVRTFYRVAGEICGVKLTTAELSFHDKVLIAYVVTGDTQAEGRTASADEIEAEDRAAEQAKLAGCRCTIA